MLFLGTIEILYNESPRHILINSIPTPADFCYYKQSQLNLALNLSGIQIGQRKIYN
jgi:hypothetical protein